MCIPRSVLIWKARKACRVGPPRVLGLGVQGAQNSPCQAFAMLAPLLQSPPVMPSHPSPSWFQPASLLLSAGRKLSASSIAPALSASAAEVRRSWEQMWVMPVGSRVLAREPPNPEAYTPTQSTHALNSMQLPLLHSRHRHHSVWPGGLSLELEDVNTNNCTPGLSALPAQLRA